MNKSELRQIIKEEINKAIKERFQGNLSESQKLNTQQEMKNLMNDILESNEKVKQLMKQKGYEI
jgi:hypothetical protein|tara:strand:+ start:2981 stop:3172 length:192 start_codon:yes stop_codon:yes gene_type:complete